MVLAESSMTAVRDAFARIPAVMDLIPAGLMLVEDCSSGARVVACNAGCARLLGATLDGGTAAVEAAQAYYRPDRAEPLPRSERPWLRAMATGEVVHEPELHLRRPDGEWRVLAATALPLGGEGRIEGALVVVQDVTTVENASLLRKAQEASRVAAFLAEAAALLSESLDHQQTMARLCSICVQWLADWCVLDLLDGRELYRLAGACADPGKEQILERLRQRHPARPDSRHPAATVLRTGEPLLVSDASEEVTRSYCEDADHVELIQALGRRSLVSVPLVARGQTLGVFTMGSATPGRYGPADLELAQELARRAASAIDNARMYRELQRQEEARARIATELERELAGRKEIEKELLERVEMAALTADVGMAMTQGDTLQATLQRCAEAMVHRVGAALARIWVHDPEHGVLALQASAGLYTHRDGPHSRIRVGHLKVGKIAQERRPYLTNDVPGDPLVDGEWARREGMVSFAGLPLLTGGKLAGVMVMFARRPLGDVVVKALASIGDAVAVAIQRGVAESARAALEEQLRQAQKLESVGRLAGGIAHDFNNLLTVILSGAEMLQQDLGASSSPVLPMLDEIAIAGVRARDLTRQLLAFARRQVITPVALDLNALVLAQEKLLRRVLSEDVELVTRLDPDLWLARCDPGQMQQVILNLAVNARDAMPKGGTLTVETSNLEVDATTRALFSGVEPGPHVRIAIRDSGVGMPPEVKARLFEPFFTTKPIGKGTGLGLATVYGIVKQSGGAIRVESEPGHGTTFELVFPRSPGAATAAAPAEPGASPEGKETILVVEDEPEVRAVTVRSLRAGGYEVLAAGGGEEALEIGRREPGTIHLLVTDVVMPGQDGRRVAQALRQSHPEMRVLYVSGHADEVLANRGVLETGIELLQKPFTPSSLLARVRAVLDVARS